MPKGIYVRTEKHLAIIAQNRAKSFTPEARARSALHSPARSAVMRARNLINNPMRRAAVRAKVSANNGMRRPEIQARCRAVVGQVAVKVKKMAGGGGFLKGLCPPGFRDRVLDRAYHFPEDAERCKYEKRLWFRYRISPEDIARSYEQKGRCCPVCSRPLDLDDRQCVKDHCHATGRFRGLLHLPCNLALGHLEAIDASLSKAFAYLNGGHA